MMIKNIARILVSSYILLGALPVKALPVVPDAGQTIRELQQKKPELSPPKTTPPLQPISAPQSAASSVPETKPASAASSVPETKPESASLPATTPGLRAESDPWKTLLENKSVRIDYSNFVPGTVRLKPEVGPELDAVAGFAHKYPEAKLEIIGYSDTKAFPSLSLGFADSVRNYLVTKGVAGKRLTIKGEGSANPIGDNETREGRAKNRRVEISLLTNEENKEPVTAPVPVPESAASSVPETKSASAASSVPETKPESATLPATTSESVTEADPWKTLLENKPVGIGNDYFTTGTTKLKPEAGKELKTLVEFAYVYPDAKLEVTGYCMCEYKSLSLGLAGSVKNYLVSKGVADNRITVKGEVSINLVPDKSRVNKRRVEVRSLTKEEYRERKVVPAAAVRPVHVNARMMVKSIHVTGNSVFASTELEALLTDLVGGEHTLAELNEGAARITAYYHERGYIVSRAYIPPQEIKDGALTISVQEGRIGEQQINNQSRLSDQRADEYLSVIKSGDVLQAEPVNRALLLLNETPGVSAARGSLQPGASIGTADIVVELLPSAPYSGQVQLDNYGSYYTGENRLGAELALNSPLNIGDLVTFRALKSDQDLTYGYVAYQIPVGGSGLRLGGTYSGTSYSLGKELASSQSHGTATVAGLFGVYPFIRSQESNITGTISLEDKHLNDVTASVPSDKKVIVATFDVTGNREDRFGGGGITLFDLSLSPGILSMDDTSLLIDQSSANTNGSFIRLNFNLNRLQRLADRDSLSLALSGQLSNKNLNSSEQFSLGGVYGVRAYPQGEAFGDEGLLVNMALRHNFTQTLQGVLFYDAGLIKINHDPYLAGSNTRFLSGGGVGVNTNIYGIGIKADYSMRGAGGQPTSEPTTKNEKSRLWLQLSKYF
jgi:hemolysin activation/secretion protein/outer membrane protein OmpA-like peptidoglycan-associated protein